MTGNLECSHWGEGNDQLSAADGAERLLAHGQGRHGSLRAECYHVELFAATAEVDCAVGLAVVA